MVSFLPRFCCNYRIQRQIVSPTFAGTLPRYLTAYLGGCPGLLWPYTGTTSIRSPGSSWHTILTLFANYVKTIRRTIISGVGSFAQKSTQCIWQMVVTALWWHKSYDPSSVASQVPRTGCYVHTITMDHMIWTKDQQMRRKMSGNAHRNRADTHMMCTQRNRWRYRAFLHYIVPAYGEH